MANPEHLEILDRGVTVWNGWRMEHPELRPDLTGASLGAVNLEGAFLRYADLSMADLTATNLRRANLSRTNFSGAKLNATCLFAADLRQSVLSGAHLYRADLEEANLAGADLTGTNLSGIALRGVNLVNAILYETVFGNTDLTGARGLALCVHRGPCTIDHRSLSKCTDLPLSFLRGCGLPDQVIENLPSRLNGAIQFYSCFINYSTNDQDFAQHLHADLQNQGVRCWLAPHDIKGGRKLYKQIDEAIRVSDLLLLILSEHSANSEWVKTEIANARQREIREKRQMLFPISLAPYEAVRDWKAFVADAGEDSAREIRECYIPDFTKWKDHDAYKVAFQRLVRDLKAEDAGPSERR